MKARLLNNEFIFLPLATVSWEGSGLAVVWLATSRPWMGVCAFEFIARNILWAVASGFEQDILQCSPNISEDREVLCYPVRYNLKLLTCILCRMIFKLKSNILKKKHKTHVG